MNEKDILALEDKRFGAMIARDFKALEAMLHGDLLYTHSSGVTDTKATWLQSMQSGKTKYKSVNCTDRKVRVIGEVALIRHLRSNHEIGFACLLIRSSCKIKAISHAGP